MSEHVHAIAYAALSDDELVVLARRGQREAFRHIMQRGNQRVYGHRLGGDDAPTPSSTRPE